MTNEEAIKLLSQIMDALLASNSWLPSTDNPIKEAFGMAIDALQERPKGKWRYRIIGDNAYRVCSCCGWEQSCNYPWYMGYHYWYCPDCGADMRGEKDE